MCRRVKGGLDNAMGGLLEGERERLSLSEWYLSVNPLSGNTVISDVNSLKQILRKDSFLTEFSRIRWNDYLRIKLKYLGDVLDRVPFGCSTWLSSKKIWNKHVM